MAVNQFHFDHFTVDARDRRLSRDGETIDLNNRYFDALALLLREQGRLVTKDRFLDEVWNGFPVTDEALTQCIRSLRRALGDDAGKPRFIETVPKHGYRFIGALAAREDVAGSPIVAAPLAHRHRDALLLAGAATIGGGIAGILGGLFYGLNIDLQAMQPATGATSILFVLLAINMIVGMTGGAGVGLGIAAASYAPRPAWYGSVAGGMTGGLFVGGIAELVGLDAFGLLLGRSPGNITGGAEGAILGGAVGLAVSMARARNYKPAQSAAVGGLITGAAGLLISLSGGRLLAGSLDRLLAEFPGARFRLDTIGSLFGETAFGPVSQLLTAGIEGLLFGACLLAALSFCWQGVKGEVGGARPLLPS